VFGNGRLVPLDRNAKARIMTMARARMRCTEKHEAYGVVRIGGLVLSLGRGQ